MVAMPTSAQSDANCRLSAHLCSSISTIVLNSLCVCEIYIYITQSIQYILTLKIDFVRLVQIFHLSLWILCYPTMISSICPP